MGELERAVLEVEELVLVLAHAEDPFGRIGLEAQVDSVVATGQRLEVAGRQLERAPRGIGGVASAHVFPEQQPAVPVADLDAAVIGDAGNGPTVA